MVTVPQAIAADILRKAAIDALEFGHPLIAGHVGCSYAAWYESHNPRAFSEKRAELFQAHASMVRDSLHLLGFAW